MTKTKNLFFVALLCCLFTPFLTGCFNQNNNTGDNYQWATRIDLDSSSSVVEMALDGEDFQLLYTVHPTNATNKNVTFSSTNTSVATVSDTGVITAVGVGTAWISVKSTDNYAEAPGVTALVKVVANKQTLSQPTNLSYDSVNKKLTWNAVSVGEESGFTPNYTVYIKKDGGAIQEIDTSINELNGIEPGAYQVYVQAIGNASMYNDSIVSETISFTQLDAPSQLKLIINETEEQSARNFFIQFKMAPNTTSINDYEISLKRTSSASGTSLSSQDQALWNESIAQATVSNGYISIPVPQGLTNASSTSIAVKTKSIIPNNIYGSEYCEDIKIQQLNAPQALNLVVVESAGEQKRKLTWSAVENAHSYKILVKYTLPDGSYEYSVAKVDALGTNATIFDWEQITDAPSNFTAYEVYMFALGSADSLGIKYFDSVSSLRAFKQLESVESITIQPSLEEKNYKISWSDVVDAGSYEVYISSNSNAVISDDDKLLYNGGVCEAIATFDQTYTDDFGRQVPLWSAGDNFIKIIAKKGSDNSFTDSNVQVAGRKLIKIATPSNFTVSYGELSWSSVENATKYIIDFGGGNTKEIAHTEGKNVYSYVPTSTEIANSDVVYYVSIYASNENSFYIPSQQTDTLSITRYPTITNVYVQDGKLVWKFAGQIGGFETTDRVDVEITNSSGEVVGVLEKVSIYNEVKIAEILNELNATDRFYTFRVRPVSNLSNGTALNGYYSDPINTYQIPAPTGLKIEDGVITWDRFADDYISANHAGLRYELKIESGGSNTAVIITSDKDGNVFGVNTTSAVLTELVANVTYNISLKTTISSSASSAGGYDPIINEDTYIINSLYSAPITAKLLETPYNLRVEDNILRWSASSTSVESYNVTIYKIDNDNGQKTRSSVVVSEVISGFADPSAPSFNFVTAMDNEVGFNAGGYEFVVSAIGNDGTRNAFITSHESLALEIYKLQTPILQLQDGGFTWEPISYILDTTAPVTGYRIYVENGYGETFVKDVTTNSTYLEWLPENFWDYGTDEKMALQVSVQAISNGIARVYDSEISSYYSRESSEAVTKKVLIYKLPKITLENVSVNGNTVTWEKSVNFNGMKYALDVYTGNDKKVDTFADYASNSVAITNRSGGVYYIKIQQKTTDTYTLENIGEVRLIRSEYSDAINIFRFSETIGQAMAINSSNQPVVTWNMPQNNDNEYSRFKITVQHINIEGSVSGTKYIYYKDYESKSLDLFNTIPDQIIDESGNEVLDLYAISSENIGSYLVSIQTIAKLNDEGEAYSTIEQNGQKYLLMDSKLISLEDQIFGMTCSFIIQDAPKIDMTNGIINLVDTNQNNKGFQLKFTKLVLSGDELIDSSENPFIIDLGFSQTTYVPNFSAGEYYKVETKAMGNSVNLIESRFVQSNWVVYKLDALNANTTTATYSANGSISNLANFNGWYVLDGNICWNKIEGVTTYKLQLSNSAITDVQEYENDNSSYSKSITNIEFGVYELTFELIGGNSATKITYQDKDLTIAYLSSNISDAIKVNKLFAPNYKISGEYTIADVDGTENSKTVERNQSYSRIDDNGEFDFGLRDSLGKWIDDTGATKYVINIDDSYNLIYDLATQNNAQFIASEQLTEIGNYIISVGSIGNTWTGLSDSVNQIYLSSDLGSNFVLRYLGQLNDFRIKDGMFVWDDSISGLDTGYDISFTTASGEDSVNDLTQNTYYFQDEAHSYLKGEKINSIKVRFSGTSTATNANAAEGYVNTVWSNVMSNIVKLPDLQKSTALDGSQRELYINEFGQLSWLAPEETSIITQDVLDNLLLNISVTPTINGESQTSPNIAKRNLTNLIYDVPSLIATGELTVIYKIVTYIEGYVGSIQENSDVVYLNSNPFEFNAPKLNAPKTLTMDTTNAPLSSDGFRINWDITGSSIHYEGLKEADLLCFTYRLKGQTGYKQHIVSVKDYLLSDSASNVIGQNVMWELGTFQDVRLRVLNSNGLAFASNDCNLNKEVTFDFFAGGNGTRENPFIIQDIQDSYSALLQLEYMFWLPDMYFEINQDINLPELNILQSTTNMPYPSNLFNEEIDEKFSSLNFTGGIYANNHSITNYQVIGADSYAMWNSITSDGLTYALDNDTKFLNRNGIINGLQIQVHTIDLTNVYNEYNGIFANKNYGTLYNCATYGINKYDEEGNPISVFINNIDTGAPKTLYFGGLVGLNSVYKVRAGVANETSNIIEEKYYFEILSYGRVENCTNMLNMEIFAASSEIEGGTIQRLDNQYFIGGVVGYNMAGYVINCTNGSENKDPTEINQGNLNAYYTGGIVGKNSGTTIQVPNTDTSTEEIFIEMTYYSYVSGCINYAEVSNCIISDTGVYSGSGGIVGYLSYGYVTFCINYGYITTSSSGDMAAFLGGIVASQTEGSYTLNNINLGPIFYQSASANQGGTIVAIASGYIKNNLSESNANYNSIGLNDDSIIDENNTNYANIINLTSEEFFNANNQINTTDFISRNGEETIYSVVANIEGNYAQYSKEPGSNPTINWVNIDLNMI